MARQYALTGKNPEKPLSGQAKAIFDGMSALTDKETGPAKLDGKAWTDVLKGTFATRQDNYRVVLYYLLIFKKRGLVAVHETVPTPAEAASELAGDNIPATEAVGDVVTE